MSPIRAVGLLSGGLDSALAARLLLDQGIDVIGLHLESPTACRSDVHEVARELGIPIEVRAKGDEYLRLLRHPRWGYGRNMNPCIDCRHFMFRIGQTVLEEQHADFLFTGEVLGQRPMSQTRASLLLIDRESGLDAKILRPLSARLLPETEPERRGWVDRSLLLDLSGRSRERQIELANHYGLKHFQSPGGGCLLTDALFSRKLRDLFDHVPEEATGMDDVALLRVGRHFRVDADRKVVLGRDAQENARLTGYAAPGRWIVEPDGFNGPTALVCGPVDEVGVMQAIALIARYTRTPEPTHRVRWRDGDAWRTRALGESAEPLVRISAL